MGENPYDVPDSVNSVSRNRSTFPLFQVLFLIASPFSFTYWVRLLDKQHAETLGYAVFYIIAGLAFVGVITHRKNKKIRAYLTTFGAIVYLVYFLGWLLIYYLGGVLINQILTNNFFRFISLQLIIDIVSFAYTSRFVGASGATILYLWLIINRYLNKKTLQLKKSQKGKSHGSN